MQVKLVHNKVIFPSKKLGTKSLFVSLFGIRSLRTQYGNIAIFAVVSLGQYMKKSAKILPIPEKKNRYYETNTTLITAKQNFTL